MQEGMGVVGVASEIDELGEAEVVVLDGVNASGVPDIDSRDILVLGAGDGRIMGLTHTQNLDLASNRDG